MRIFSRVIAPAAVVALLAGAAAFGPASAWDSTQGLRPNYAESINLGYVNGIAYYTPTVDGFQVVATLSVGGGAPLQVEATLQPEQRITVSVPGPEGTTPKRVEIVRRGDRVTVNKPVSLVLN
ncbi:MAG TPA: hypothetical protein VLA00_18090 [Xanthobacteraceae bacterium]|nr:hypothetical protein [Xanthobacteraceae bacterium]